MLVAWLSVLAIASASSSVATRNSDAVGLATVADENAEGTAQSGNLTRTAAAAEVAEYGDCFYVCPTWTNVLVVGLVVLLFICLCGAVTQHQPREIWYVVDRSNEPVPPRPPSLPPRQSASQQRQPQIASP